MRLEEINLLVVEDNSFDLRMLKRAMRRIGLDMPMQVATNGYEALAVLRGECGHAQLPRPNLVLLDINMPLMDGHTFLAHLRKDNTLRDVVVFIHSTSSAPDDIRRAYENNVAGYIVKDGRIDSSVEDLMMLADYAKRVTLPLQAS